eukprot:gene25713-33577_t
MPPHGEGFVGSTHSHSVEYPDDSWNLYAMLDQSTTALNVTSTRDTIGIFKPFALRLTPFPVIISDADCEIIVIARFTSPVHIRKIMVIGGGNNDANHPSFMKCFADNDTVDFTNVNTLTPSQEFNLPINRSGTVELITAIHPFTNVTSVAFYFNSNQGGSDITSIQYIGLQGEHTHYRRQAVNAVYEVLCNGQDVDHVQEEALGSHHLH